MKDYKLTVGLEIHAELNTKTKMFCDSKNDPDEIRPNSNICPVCLGYPGTLPVINKEAVKSVLCLGLALGGEMADFTEFDRKNYFYPDIPKGYQISQYKFPLVRGGKLAGVALTRIHLEEDTAKSTHDKSENSLLDFNRAGVPLVELVTEPEIHDVEVALKFAKEFQLVLRYLGISGADMEKGTMRVEANISMAKSGERGTKVEVKNLNSFRVMERAIRFEMERQVSVLESGEAVVQETRGWDENKGETFSQRLKESAHDYRYFPDPDLPKLYIKEIPDFNEEVLKKTLPELPWQKRDRYKREYKLKDEDIEIYVRDFDRSLLLEGTADILREVAKISLASNYIINDLKKAVEPKSLRDVIEMVSRGEISSRGAKEILKILETEGGQPKLIAEKSNLIQKSNIEELNFIAQKILDDNPEAVSEYKKGKLSALQFLIGQAMKETRGSANPQALNDIFTKIL